MMTNGTVQLADGRTLACEDAGDADGFPVIVAHGFPGSRLEARVVDESAAGAGVRLVCPDRTGFGRADSRPGRQLGDWPADVAVLADHLRLGNFEASGLPSGYFHTGDVSGVTLGC